MTHNIDLVLSLKSPNKLLLKIGIVCYGIEGNVISEQDQSEIHPNPIYNKFKLLN